MPREQEEESILVYPLDGLPCRLRAEADLSWLSGYGRGFRVMDDLPSGNLCFGVEGAYGRLFIKYAGARTLRFGGRPDTAVSLLKRGVELYGRFSHPALIPLLAHGPIGDGYAAVFPWQEGETPIHGTAALAAFRRLPTVTQLTMTDRIFDLQASLAAGGLVAVDFTDEHVLLDFSSGLSRVCDIDLYKPRPAFNTLGRMPGSNRFLAPEEFIMGEELDESTTVYKLGALAFTLFGDHDDPCRETWTGPGRLYPVAEKALSEKKKARFATVRAFLDAWRAAVEQTPL